MASCGIEVNAVLNLMKILVTPEVKKKDTENEKPDDIFGTILRNSLGAFWQSLDEEKHFEVKKIFQKNCHILRQKCNAESTIQTYLEVCQVLLFSLHEVIQQKMAEFKKTEKRELKPNEAPPLSPETLSVNHQKIVLSILQFIAVLGVCPHLQPGVGIPIERRSEFGKLLLESSVFPDMSSQENYVSFLKTVWVLVTCLGSRSLGQVILSRHLGDILAALLQIVHGRHDAKDESGQIAVVRETEQKGDDAASERRKMDTDSGNWTPATMVDMVTQRSVTDSINEIDENKIQNDSDINENSHQTQSSKRQEEANTETQQSNNNDQMLADTKREEWTMNSSFCEDSLSDLVKKVHPSLLVRELLLLQGAPGPSFTKKQSVNRKFVLSRSPKWLRRICGRMLSDILMGTDGVINIIKGMLGNVPDDSNVGPPDWRKFDAVAKVISTCPSHLESVEEYYQKISSQILQMFHPRDRQIGRGLLRVACTTISLMSSQNRALTDRYIIQPLCKPLIQSTKHHGMDADNGGQFIIVDETEVRDCIEGLHKVFVGGVEPSSPLYICLLPICQPLFELFCFTREGPSHLSSSSQEVLVSVLKNLDPSLCLSVLKFLILQDNIDVSTESMKILDSNLTFAAGSQGGVVIVTRLQSDAGDTDYNRVVRAMVDILRPLQQTGVTGDFLIFTLQELQRIISNEISSDDQKLSEPVSSDHSTHCLLDIEDRQNREWRSHTQRIVVLSVLAQLCEDLGPGCIKSSSQTLKFVQATLERAIQICSQSEDEKTEYFESETLTMAMSLLTAMLSGAIEMSSKDREDMNSLMPLLDEISQVHTDLSVQEMASDLRIAIATHGVVMSEKLEKKTPKDAELPNARKSKAKPLIEELSCQPSPDKPKISSDGEKDRANSGLTELGQAMEEICDPLIPVRGHALITICRLIKKRDPEAVKKQETLLKIFQENLAHLDSYLYLAAVNGMVAMVDIVPDTIIPCLVQEYRGRSSQTEGKGQKSKVNAETRMKVGECLVQTSRNLGDMAPKFRDLLLSTFLLGTKDPDPLIRASSMSNLGEVCSVLKFNLGPIIQEIFTCCSALLKSDPDAEVRKASALTLMLILRGLGHSAIQVLDSVMRDLYQLLKLILRSEKDEGVQRQTVLVYNELEDIMREVLFPKQTLQKKIRVRNAEC